MEKLFEVELTHPYEEGNEACAVLSLPAMPYELRDALDKVRITDGGNMIMEITETAPSVRYLSDHMEEGTCKVPAVYLLNALAEKIAGMSFVERCAFEGLVRVEFEKEIERIPAAQLYDYAFSTDCCHVVPEVDDYAALGKFYVDNDFLPEFRNVPEKALAYLDYTKIGKEQCMWEGGVMLPGGGYVTQHTELAEAAKDFVPQEPDYTVLLEIRHGEKTRLLKMPSTVRESASALEAVGASDWPDVAIRCVDCKIPALTDAITKAEDPDRANQAAQMLEKLSDRDAVIYKALLEAAGVPDLEQALQMMDGLDQYLLTREYASPADVGRSHLLNLLGGCEAEYMLPHVNLYGFGESMIQRFHYSMTPYGAIERRDGEPIREVFDRQADAGREAGNHQSKPQRKHREPSR